MTLIPDLIHPTIHLNGSNVIDLEQSLEKAYTSLGHAMGAMRAAAPNARDYYPQGDGAYRRAMAQHEDRLARTAEVLNELQAMAEHLAEQRCERENQKR